MIRFEVGSPGTKEEITAALGRLEGELCALAAEMSAEEFAAPQGEHWSPERHIRHLSKSVRAVAGGMRVARLLLRLRFGRPWRPSRSFGDVVEIYREALVQGADAGSFTPSERPPEVTAEEWRGQVIDRWRQASASLQASIGRWKEPALDRYQLPHPLLGKMTMREILFFTVYHNAHHARRIEERRAGAERQWS